MNFFSLFIFHAGNPIAERPALHDVAFQQHYDVTEQHDDVVRNDVVVDARQRLRSPQPSRSACHCDATGATEQRVPAEERKVYYNLL